ncbi:hypothetical protein QJQ45_004619 [Haematococcus lacustris]|nr:hypothetical protein QJQ45_004619 [Haematococcus lacustris]
MTLIDNELSEPYSIFTYRYFLHNWPHLCWLTYDGDRPLGCVVCKMDVHREQAMRGYVAMLVVDKAYRGHGIGSELVKRSIQSMIEGGCEEVVLEAEVSNTGALRLYEGLGFLREKRLHRYYLNGQDAYRLKLLLPLTPEQEAALATKMKMDVVDPSLNQLGSKGIAEQREFVFDPATQIGVAIDPGVTQAVSAASGVWDERSGLNNSRREVYLDPKWARQRLRLYEAQDWAQERFFKELAVALGEVGVRMQCCRPRGSDQRRGRVVLVDQHRTTRVSSAVNGQQPCEEELNHEQPTRPADWKPPPGQVEHRLMRPAWSQQRDLPVRGLMWCPVMAPRKPPQPQCSSQAATQPAASEPGPSTPPPAKRDKRTKAEPEAAELTQPTKAAEAKPAPQPGRWLDRDSIDEIFGIGSGTGPLGLATAVTRSGTHHCEIGFPRGIAEEGEDEAGNDVSGSAALSHAKSATHQTRVPLLAGFPCADAFMLQEDAHLVDLELDSQTGLMAPSVLKNTEGWAAGNLSGALQQAFLALDASITTSCPASSGTTSTVALLRGNQLIVAGVGDSKGMFVRGGRAMAMTVDHRPDAPEEEARIRGAGGFVHRGRVNACLNVSRALGDAQFKQDACRGPHEQQVSPQPDVREAHAVSPTDFLLLCSDGVWNSMRENVVLRFVRQKLLSGLTPADVCAALCRACLEPSCTAYDNITALLCKFKPSSLPQGGAQAQAAQQAIHQQHHRQQQQQQQQQQLSPQRKPATAADPASQDAAAQQADTLASPANMQHGSQLPRRPSAFSGEWMGAGEWEPGPCSLSPSHKIVRHSFDCNRMGMEPPAPGDAGCGAPSPQHKVLRRGPGEASCTSPRAAPPSTGAAAQGPGQAGGGLARQTSLRPSAFSNCPAWEKEEGEEGVGEGIGGATEKGGIDDNTAITAALRG